MPTINVTERSVSPKLDRGLLAGLLAGGVSYLWLLLIGLLSGNPVGTFTDLAALAVGEQAFVDGGFANWLVGTVVYFIVFALLGVVFAALWPRLRRSGTWVPAILFGLAAYLVVVQLVFRLVQPALPGELNHFALITAFFLAGLTFAYRYRRA